MGEGEYRPRSRKQGHTRKFLPQSDARGSVLLSSGRHGRREARSATGSPASEDRGRAGGQETGRPPAPGHHRRSHLRGAGRGRADREPGRRRQHGGDEHHHLDPAGVGDDRPRRRPPGAAESAAGKPCVARSQPLPEGAPEVDVAVGPPPTALVSRDVTLGTGASVPPKATVTVKYIGVACSTGVIFDASYGKTPRRPGHVLPGRRHPRLEPRHPRHGRRRQAPPGHPPRPRLRQRRQPQRHFAPQETLWFVVELVDFKPPA